MKHITITVIFGFASVIIGISVTSISVVFGILGSTTYPLLGNILPAVFFLKLVPKNKFKLKRKVALIQAIFVGVVSACSLFWKIYEMIMKVNEEKCAWVQSIKT